MSVEINQVLNDDVLVHSELVSENIKFLRVQYYKKTNILNVRVKSSNLLDTNKNNLLKDIISKRLGSFKNINLLCCRYINGVKPEEIIDSYWDSIVDSVGSVVPVCKECLNKSKRSFESGQILVSTGNEFVAGILRTKGIEKIIREVILDYFDVDILVRFQFSPELEEENSIINEKIKTTNINSIDEVCIAKNNKEKILAKHNQEKAETKPNISNVIVGKHFSDLKLDIKDIDEPLGMVAIEGDIFKVDIIKTKNDKTIMCFYITDYTSSIQVKYFPKPKDLERVLSEIREGVHCSVKGNAQNDIYSKEITILARDIVKSSKFEKEDNALEKRVELHLHTQMSSMDGMTSVSRLIERAAKWGHSAIAITDHGVLQAFPEAMTASKKYNIKVIYGVEAYLVDDEVPIAKISEDKSLEDTYVVFDLETTGLSPKLDRIIEIGAVKISKGLVIDRFSTFVNPGIKIPDKIIELTSIDDSLVKDSKGIDEILPVFLEFTKGCILVAHNAEFDVSFIKNKCQDLNIPFDYDYMDTILLCKFLYPELKKYKLDVVAHHLGIDLKSHHRAVDDAKATGEILLNCFSKLVEMNIESLSQLNKNYLETIDMRKLPTNHLIILVKNQVGLKNLYKLISKSNLDYFYKKPRMPKSEINRLREGLIIGSACEAGQIYRGILSGKSDAELTSLISFYDYLEIQPLGNNDFLIRNGTVKDKDSLKDINFRIINLGKKNNLPVVATCDVHFLDPRDSVFRKILMFGQGFSDAEEQAPLYLRTTDEMLQEFSYLGEALAKEVVITNPKKISELIGDVLPIPNETFPPKIEGAEDELRQMTNERAHAIYGEVLPEVVQKRLDKELNSIINHGYAVLYLIAQKLVSKSLEDGYMVGSRGSVGSSFAATMSNITEVNGLPPHYVCPKCKNSEFILDGSVASGADLPDKDCPKCGAKYRKDGDDIPFETFLGFEGDKEPDIDLNFSGEYQAVVHKYTEVLFGKGFVFKAGTIGTVAEKTAYGYVQKYLTAKGIIVPKAEIERLTKGCTGIKRTTGQHPGGIMVVPSDNEIYNFTPIQHPADDKDTDIITTHFDYHSISGRLLKLDILGHDDPTMFKMLQDLTGLDPKSIPLGDDKVMSLFESPKALGVTADELGCEVGTYGLPEFGTKFVRQMLLDTSPKTFSDLVRISGLSHGTDVWLNNAQYFIKTGKTTLKDCISTRDDIMIYLMHQGVVPKTAFTIMEKVRKGKGLNEDDIEAMKKNDVPDWYIESCLKIKYMFPKGHAVAYVMSAVRIAYYKVYYPEAYYATYFTVRADDFDTELIFKGEDAIKRKMNELNALGNNITQKDKSLLTILEISYEMFKRNIKLLKVDLYNSHATKFLIVEGGILPPLRALVGVGENAAKSIAQVRENGEFLSKEDLRIRAKVTKTVIETLSKHGCLDGITETNQLTLF